MDTPLSTTISAPSKRSHRGGWRSYSGIQWAEKRLIHELAHRARFNVALDVRPPEGFEGSEQDRKRWCRDRIRALGQALKRRGQKWIGVTIWEQNDETHRQGIICAAWNRRTLTCSKSSTAKQSCR